MASIFYGCLESTIPIERTITVKDNTYYPPLFNNALCRLPQDKTDTRYALSGDHGAPVLLGRNVFRIRYASLGIALPTGKPDFESIPSARAAGAGAVQGIILDKLPICLEPWFVIFR